ncbi:hypothetical protein [Actinomadura parmotrematis]|uniref:Uncharacterized protein n=1 Tax=Actinomadura parmotrematis TaxID=2864039 RepID=A0ABS7FZN2_9ACTN|nr:hypothetical protein [Actinomadura parmotrematis]MBW8485761.1 hypothetical protein [Actinomadura parmotrematis]
MGRMLRGGVAGLAVAAVLATGGVADAATGWRITATPDAKADLRDIVALSAKDAWAVGYKSGTGALIRHWNGTTWKNVAVPAVAKAAYLESVSATSSKDVWIGGTDGHLKQYWLHWNGKKWKWVAGTLPSNSDPSAPDLYARSATDVWSFAQTGGWDASKPDVRHYNGKKWSKVASPGIIREVSPGTGKDLWATAWVKGPQSLVPAVLRWDGKTWKKQAQPFGTEGQSALNGILARGSKNVWAVGYLGSKSAVVHWDGKTWKKFAAPNSTEALGTLVDDGAGGLWAKGSKHFFHYRNGAWTATAIPARSGLTTQVATLAHVPKTTSTWGVGALDDSDWIHRYNLVLKFH